MSSGLPTRFPTNSTTTLFSEEVAPHGFMPYLYVADAESDPVLRIVRGLIGLIPTTGTGDDTDYALGEKDYFVKVTYNADGLPTEAEIVRVDVDDLPTDTATYGHQFLFRVDAAGTVTIKDVWSSLRTRMCAGTPDFWPTRGGA